MNDGSCLQLHIRSGTRYLWTITDFTRFQTNQCLESSTLYFQFGDQRKSFNLKIFKAKSNMPRINSEFCFLHFNFQEKHLDESQCLIRYCICDPFGRRVTKMETVEIRIDNGKNDLCYLKFVTEEVFQRKIEEYGTLIIDILVIDVAYPSLLDVTVDRTNGNYSRIVSPISTHMQQKQSHLDTIGNFKHLYKQDSTSDVILVVKDQRFLVHKIVLITRSSAFSLVLLPMLSAKQKVCLTIDDFDPVVVSKMLRYMYLNKVDKIQGMVFDLYRIAKKYELGGLAYSCVKCMEDQMNVDNAISIFFFAVKNEILALIDSVKEFIRTNADDVLNSGMFIRLINSSDFREIGI